MVSLNYTFIYENLQEKFGAVVEYLTVVPANVAFEIFRSVEVFFASARIRSVDFCEASLE
jgi:hypothetical protein